MSQPPRVRTTPGNLAQWVREVAGMLNAIPWQFTGTKTADYTADHGECVICDPSGGGFTVTLPKARDGAKVAIKNDTTSTNTITIAAGSGDTADVASMATARQAITFYADGTKWRAL